MNRKLLCVLVFVLSSCSIEGIAVNAIPQLQAKKAPLDPTPHLLPKNHPLRPILNTIFANPKVLRTQEAFAEAGFITKFLRQKTAFLRVAQHPAVPGYLFKVYLQSETPLSRVTANRRLTRRAVEAARTRKFIKSRKLQHFTVPQKWIYKPPSSKILVLVVEDMQLVSHAECSEAWKTKVTYSHLKELHVLLKRGLGSLALTINIPYTKQGTFSFIDTEFSPRKFKLQRIEKYLGEEMKTQWQELRKK